jgi:3-hydroxyisobutyrate dehydrogenase-like beta-hydroxyacid dehydrogenase
MKLGFVGLGRMGAPMAARLLAAGHELKVFNRTRSAADALVSQGAKLAGDVHDLVDAEIVVSMLADDGAVRAVWLDSGLAGELPRTNIHLNMATIGLELAREMTEAHRRGASAYVSAPVFGRPAVAAQGGLDTVVAGAPAAVERCRAVLGTLARQVFVAGEEPYKANAVKIARNFLLAAMIEGLGEAFALVRKCGVGEQAFLDILLASSLGAPAYRSYGKLMVERHWRPAAFAMALGLKDVELALSTARAAGVRLRTAEVIRDQLAAAIAAGRGEEDWAALAAHIAAESGLAS